jgi:hypothetical protein
VNGSRNLRGWLLAAVAVAFVARAAFAFLYWQNRPLTIDQTEYLMLAERVAQGNGLTFPPGERRLMRSPGYPLFLAATRSIAPGQNAVKAVQCLLGVLAVLQVAAIGRRLGGEHAAVGAAWFAALYPPLVFEPAYILSEPLYTVLGLSAVLVGWDMLEARTTTRRLGRAALAGLAAGATLLVRPEFALFVGLLGLLLLWRRQWVAAIILGAVAVVVVAPWPVYNVLEHGRVIFLSSRGGPNFWMGNNALALGDGDVSSNPPMAHEYVTLIQNNPTLTAEDLERLFYRRAGEFIRAHPLQWAALLAKKAFWFVVPFGPSYRSRSGLFFASQAASWLLLLGMGIAAWPRIRRVRPPPVVLALAAGSVVLTCIIFFPLVRYRVPLLDPVLIACVGDLARPSRRSPGH